MTIQELEQQYLVVDGMTFIPRYTVTQIEVIEDGETILVDDYTITVTTQEVYAEWQAQQNSTPQPSTESVLLEYVADLDYRLSLKEMGLWQI